MTAPTMHVAPGRRLVPPATLDRLSGDDEAMKAWIETSPSPNQLLCVADALDGDATLHTLALLVDDPPDLLVEQLLEDPELAVTLALNPGLSPRQAGRLLLWALGHVRDAHTGCYRPGQERARTVATVTPRVDLGLEGDEPLVMGGRAWGIVRGLERGKRVLPGDVAGRLMAVAAGGRASPVRTFARKAAEALAPSMPISSLRGIFDQTGDPVLGRALLDHPDVELADARTVAEVASDWETMYVLWELEAFRADPVVRDALAASGHVDIMAHILPEFGADEADAARKLLERIVREDAFAGFRELEKRCPAAIAHLPASVLTPLLASDDPRLRTRAMAWAAELEGSP